MKAARCATAIMLGIGGLLIARWLLPLHSAIYVAYFVGVGVTVLLFGFRR